MSFLNSVKISLTPLSPIHIGCGEDYEPTNYVIRGKTLYGFDPSSVKLSAQEFSKLKLVSRSNRIPEWANFFKANADSFIPFFRSACTCCPKAKEIYDLMTTKGIDRNQGFIERTSYVRYPEGDFPYIPGSGIKGAFTTALMDTLKEDGKNKYGDKDNLIKKIFGVNENHGLGRGVTEHNLTPMRFLKFSDCLSDGKTYGLTEISSAARVSKKDSATGNKIPVVFENLTFCNYRPYNGVITQEDMPRDVAMNVKAKFDIEAAVKAVHRFNLAEFNKDKECWSNWSGAGSWIKSISELLEKLDSQIKEGKICLIRLGKNQGVGGFTLSDNTKIKNRVTGEFMSDATTVWQCGVRGQYLPFGWALLEVDPQQENAALLQWVKSQENPSLHLQNEVDALKKKRADIEKKEEGEKKAKEIAEKTRLEEAKREAAEKERLASLPENERLVENLFAKMKRATRINPGDALYKEVREFLEKAAQEWSPENKLMCAEKLQPLVKAKGMYQGKNEKILKNLFKTMRGQ